VYNAKISFSLAQPGIVTIKLYNIAGQMVKNIFNGYKPAGDYKMNLDIKGFTEDYYLKYCLGELQPVLESAKIMQEEGVWIELTNLILPTINDDMKVIREMCEWIIKNLGPDVPLYFSRFFPAYKMTHLPPTPVETLEKAREIAQEVGLHYVYIGNVPGNPAEHTYCPECYKKMKEKRKRKLFKRKKK